MAKRRSITIRPNVLRVFFFFFNASFWRAKLPALRLREFRSKADLTIKLDYQNPVGALCVRL